MVVQVVIFARRYNRVAMLSRQSLSDSAWHLAGSGIGVRDNTIEIADDRHHRSYVHSSVGPTRFYR